MTGYLVVVATRSILIILELYRYAGVTDIGSPDANTAHNGSGQAIVRGSSADELTHSPSICSVHVLIMKCGAHNDQWFINSMSISGSIVCTEMVCENLFIFCCECVHHYECDVQSNDIKLLAQSVHHMPIVQDIIGNVFFTAISSRELITIRMNGFSIKDIDN